MNKILPIILVMVLSGCATVQTLKFEKTTKSIPLLNEIYEGNVGDRIVLSTEYKVGEALELKSNVKWSQLGVFQRLHHMIASGEKEFLFREYDELATEKCYGRFKTELINEKHHLLCVEKNSNEMFVRFCPLVSAGCEWGLDDYKIQDEYEYEIINMQVEDKNKEFIYTGKKVNSIKFIYREFQHGVHQVVVQPLEFDLRESNIIEFKDLRIDVIEASNQSIKYKVIRHFSADQDADITE